MLLTFLPVTRKLIEMISVKCYRAYMGPQEMAAVRIWGKVSEWIWLNASLHVFNPELG